MYLFILRWGTNFGKLLIKYLHKTNSDVKLSSGDYFSLKKVFNYYIIIFGELEGGL